MVKGTEALEREGAFLEITRQVSGRIHSTQAAPTPKASRKAPPGAPTSQGGPHCLPPPPVSWNLTLGRPALPPSAPWGHGCCSEPPGYQCSLHASPRVAFPEPLWLVCYTAVRPIPTCSCRGSTESRHHPQHPTLPRTPCPHLHLLLSLHSWHPDRSWFPSDFPSLPWFSSCRFCALRSLSLQCLLQKL